MKRLLAGLLLTAVPGLWAQDEMPALPDEQPAVKTTPPPAQRPATSTEPLGMSVVGDKESPIGLYIMPWRNSAAEGGLDRPARLLDEALLPLDPDVFRRQVDYHQALSKHLEKQGLITPVEP